MESDQIKKRTDLTEILLKWTEGDSGVQAQPWRLTHARLDHD
jgi:hypothetical protein